MAERGDFGLSVDSEGNFRSEKAGFCEPTITVTLGSLNQG